MPTPSTLWQDDVFVSQMFANKHEHPANYRIHTNLRIVHCTCDSARARAQFLATILLCARSICPRNLRLPLINVCSWAQRCNDAKWCVRLFASSRSHRVDNYSREFSVVCCREAESSCAYYSCQVASAFNMLVWLSKKKDSDLRGALCCVYYSLAVVHIVYCCLLLVLCLSLILCRHCVIA